MSLKIVYTKGSNQSSQLFILGHQIDVLVAIRDSFTRGLRMAQIRPWTLQPGESWLLKCLEVPTLYISTLYWFFVGVSVFHLFVIVVWRRGDTGSQSLAQGSLKLSEILLSQLLWG